MEARFQHLFRMLPQVGQLVDGEPFALLRETYPRRLVAEHTRLAIAQLRREIADGGHSESTLDAVIAGLAGSIAERLKRATRMSLRPVINATGVILQTNLGRAPLSERALERIAEVASGYCNLELDLDTGERGHRDTHVEHKILEVLAARTSKPTERLQDRAAAVVNNCAAACFLALNSLAEGGEVIVSRGELVEIGGGFRIPDILRKSGAVLREVGTTNRTRLSDYQAAITSATRAILRVHRSNFRIEGFTEQPTFEELLELGERSAVPLVEDQGTGCVASLDELGMLGESNWVRSAGSRVSLVTCSGDKLLGGPQCGILVGTRKCISTVKSNPLFRAMRADKLTYAALEATLMAYLMETEESIPTIAMLRTPQGALEQRCVAVAKRISSEELSAEAVATQSLVGGGTTPGASLPSFGVRFRHASLSESELAKRLRGLMPAVMCRVSGDSVIADLRTVFPFQDEALIELIRAAAKAIPHTLEESQ